MFTFTSPLLKDIKTTVTLDPKGALVHVIGQTVQRCSHNIDHKLAVDTGILVRGHQKEDSSRLTQVEWMIRGEMPKCKDLAHQHAEALTTDLVTSYINYAWKDPCGKGK